MNNSWPRRSLSAIKLLVLALLLVGSPICQAQEIELQGNDIHWNKVGNIPKMTPFMIQASGMVDFGGIGNNDGVTAGVTASEIWRTPIQPLIPSGTVGPLASGEILEANKVNVSGSWPWQQAILRSTVNYDEGGFWVALTTEDRAPRDDKDPSLVTRPALYYWYAKFYNDNVNIEYDKDSFVWVRSHDGGRSAFSKGDDYVDNRGFYTIWLNASDMTSGNADDVKSSLRMAKHWTHPVPLESRVVYKLQNVQTSSFLSAEPLTAGAKVILTSSQGGDAQRWQPTRRGDGTYVVQNLGTRGELEGTVEGVRQLLSEHVTLEGWKPFGNLDGTYSFMNPQSHRYLTADPSGNLTLSPLDGTPSQKWKLSNANK